MTVLELLRHLAVLLNDGLAMSTFKTVQSLHVGHSTSFDFTSNLAAAGWDLNENNERKFYIYHCREAYNFRDDGGKGDRDFLRSFHICMIPGLPNH